MHLVVGLGNPGSEFSRTRHNIGWEVADQLAAKLGWIAKPADFDREARKKFSAAVLDGMVNGKKLMIVKPTTYMNFSGNAVQAALAFYQALPSDLMVILDDLALPCGKIRIRAAGSSGGHNGLRDIERALATDQYPRLRLGIDAPPKFVPGKDYVLGAFTAQQRTLVDPAVGRACEAVVSWIDRGIETAMNQFNGD